MTEAQKNLKMALAHGCKKLVEEFGNWYEKKTPLICQFNTKPVGGLYAPFMKVEIKIDFDEKKPPA